MPAGKIHIGTSGYSYPGWKGQFYPRHLKPGDWLSYYSSQFNTVEINSSFYGLPPKSNLKKWAGQTFPSFVFSLKASRYITHFKKLNQPQQALATFLDTASTLGKKMGPVLFQLPANFSRDIERLKIILGLARGFKFVFEFRHDSWFEPEVYHWLQRKGCGMVISSAPCFPYHEQATGDILYIRLHGEQKLYHSAYSQERLLYFAAMIKKYSSQGIETYAYFNNDALSHAFRDALRLKQLLL